MLRFTLYRSQEDWGERISSGRIQTAKQNNEILKGVNHGNS